MGEKGSMDDGVWNWLALERNGGWKYIQALLVRGHHSIIRHEGRGA